MADEQTPHPDLSRPPAGPGEQRTQTIYMTPEQWGAHQAELQQLRGLQQAVQAQLESKEQERLKALAEKGQIEQALAEQRSAWERKHNEALANAAQIEQAWLGEKKNAALAEALAGRQFVGEAAKTAAMVRRLLAEEVEAARDGQGNPVVRDRATLRPAADYLRERLDSPEFAVFFAPRTGGGSGTDGTRTQATNQTPPPVKMGHEQLIRAWQSSQGISGFGLTPKR